MTDLQKGKSFTTLIGKAKINDKTFSGVQVSEKTGYNYTRLNLGVEIAEGSTVYAEQMGGYSPAKPIIFGMNKEDNTPVHINWADRLNETIIESQADFKVHKVGIERDENGRVIVKKFLSPMDMHDYLKEHLKDGMEISVRGSFAFSEYKGDTQRKFQIQNIFVPFEEKEKDENGKETGKILPTEYKATFTQTILLDDESFKKITPADSKEGEVTVSAYAVDYVGKKDGKEIKKNLPFSLPITVKINKEKPEATAKILDALFKVKKGKVRELTIEGDIVEGYEQQEVSSKDIQLSPEIQELIALGLYDEKEAMEKLTVRGNKVSKLVFTRPFLKKDKDDATKLLMEKDDTKYTQADLYPAEEEEEKTEELPDLTKTDAPPAEEEWMKALNL